MEVDVTVQEPGPGVVRLEPDRDIVAGGGRSRADHVAPDRVLVIVRGAPGAAYNSEGVLGAKVRVRKW